MKIELIDLQNVVGIKTNIPHFTLFANDLESNFTFMPITLSHYTIDVCRVYWNTLPTNPHDSTVRLTCECGAVNV